MDMDAAQWPALRQMRVRFVQEEDRIFLHGETRDGDAHAVWLTQRLARRLVPVLLDWLYRSQGSMSLDEPVRTRAPAAVVDASPASAARVTAQAAQGVAGAATTPAPLLQAAVPWVAHSAQLVGRRARVVLTLTQGGQAGVCMPLTAPAMRQCLRALRHAWREAEWPGDVWLLEPSAAARRAAAGAVTVH